MFAKTKKYTVLFFSLFFIAVIPRSVQAICVYTPGSVTCYMESSSDDYAWNDPTCTQTSSIETIVYSSNTRATYLRFDKVNIPKGANISSSSIRVWPASGAGGVATAGMLLDYDDCLTLEGCSSLSETLTVSNHNIDTSWSTAVSESGYYDISDLQQIVQTWINRSGYDYDQALGVKFSGSGPSHTIDGFSSLNPMSLKVEFTGGDPVLMVHMADPAVHATQKIYCHVFNASPLDKLVVKLDGGLIHEQAIGGDGGEIVLTTIADYMSLEAGNHIINAYITNASNEKYISTNYEKSWTTLHDGYPAVGIDQDNNICLKNGVSCDRFFPITDFMLDYSKLYGTYKKPVVDYTNLSWAVGYLSSPPKNTLLGWENFLDDRISHDRKICGPASWDGANGRNADINKMVFNESNCATPADANDCSYVKYTKEHPATFMWVWDDEPNLGPDFSYIPATATFPEYGLKEWIENVRQADDNHPVGNMFTGISNEFTSGTEISRTKTYTYLYGDGIHTSDVWFVDYYPYEYWRHSAGPDLENLALTVDNAIAYNRNLHPVWIMGEDEDLHDSYGLISATWNSFTSYYQHTQIIAGGKLYRQTETNCTSGENEPVWKTNIGETVSDGSCTWICEGIYDVGVLNISSWVSGIFQSGERVCSQSGCGVASGFIGRPRTGGSFTQTGISYVRNSSSLNNYPISQIVLSGDDGGFAGGMIIVGQDSGAVAVIDAGSPYYRTGVGGFEKAYDWTPGPTPKQASNAFWLAVIHGARGMGYFSYFTGVKEDVVAELTNLKSIVEDLNDVLLQPLSEKISPTGYNQWVSATAINARVDYTVREYNNETYVFAARLKRRNDTPNPWPDPTNTNNAVATIPVLDLQSGTQIEVYDESRTITSDEGEFSDSFTDYDVHIYKITEAISLQSDFDSDSDVDIFDYNILLANFGTTGDCQNPADADGDCNVGIFDYNILLGEFGSGT